MVINEATPLAEKKRSPHDIGRKRNIALHIIPPLRLFPLWASPIVSHITPT